MSRRGQRKRRWGRRGGLVLGTIGACALPLLAAQTAAAATSTYNYSSQYQYFTVPAGITAVHLAVAGGSGANGQGNYGGGSGGSGGEADGDLSVTAGQVLTLWVGGAGQPDGGQGFGSPGHDDFEGGSGGSPYGLTTGNGGGGGAASYVKLADGTIVALGAGGGGGGGGGTVGNPAGGTGGDGGNNDAGGVRTNGYDAPAGPGGNSNDAFGGSANATNSDNGGGGTGGGYQGNFGGGGGGGGGGYFTCSINNPNPANNFCFSAGGGGGGGGFQSGGGGGGAGGNSYAEASLQNASFKSSGFSASTAGQITLTYASSSNTSLTANPSTINQGQSVNLNAFVQPTDSGGTVAFSTGGQTISGCGAVPFISGGGDSWIATCATSSLPPGTDGVTATYSGDSAYGGSSGTATVTVYGTLSVTTSSLAQGTVGQSYSQTLKATGGSGNYSWSLASGSLPDGLTLSSDGTISGTPIRNQTSSFTAKVSDTTSGQTATGAESITVTGGSSAALIIQGLRFAGPGGSSDQYVELYNTTSSAVSLTGWQLVWAGGSINLPTGDSVPAHGHYLVAASGYSLGSYEAADDTASGLAIPVDGGVQLVAPNATATDQVGMTTAGAAYRAGTGLTAPTQTGAQLAFQRRMSAGAPVTDTTNNAADFVLVATDANSTDHGASAVFGAPAPQDSSYRLDANAVAKSYLLNPGETANGTDNKSYDAATGTLTIRRIITNTSSTQTITGLWLRYTSITTYGSATSKQAILTAQSASGGETVDGKVMVGATLDQPPSQPNGGGLGSSVLIDVGDGGLAPGQSIPVDLQFHVVRSGSYSFGYNAEIYTGH
jgi:Bacterial Ig-like domain (group 3)/Putative Ig domain